MVYCLNNSVISHNKGVLYDINSRNPKKRLRDLPEAKQIEALDFIDSLIQQLSSSQSIKPQSLKQHAAFGTWRKRNIDAIQYQQRLRSEWENK